MYPMLLIFALLHYFLLIRMVLSILVLLPRGGGVNSLPE